MSYKKQAAMHELHSAVRSGPGLSADGTSLHQASHRADHGTPFGGKGLIVTAKMSNPTMDHAPALTPRTPAPANNLALGYRAPAPH